MDIRNQKQLKAFARERLAPRTEAKTIILIYSAVTLGLALLVTTVNFILDLEIAKTGGLSNMGTRAVLDSVSQFLPLVQGVIVLCLDLGYAAAMLRIARGQYVSPRTLKLGFDRFWALLRLSLFRGLIFLGAGFTGIYLGATIYALTSLSNAAVALLEPALQNATTLSPAALLEGELYSQLLTAMIPCFILCGITYLLVFLPIYYRYRLAGYVLIDKPGIGALGALRESRMLMHRNRLQMLKLDLSFWYYHGALFLATFVAYGDMLLKLVGIELSVDGQVLFFVFYVLYLLCQLAVYFFLRNRVEVSYCLVYDSLKPKEPENGGLVLGNIFQM